MAPPTAAPSPSPGGVQLPSTRPPPPPPAARRSPPRTDSSLNPPPPVPPPGAPVPEDNFLPRHLPMAAMAPKTSGTLGTTSSCCRSCWWAAPAPWLPGRRTRQLLDAQPFSRAWRAAPRCSPGWRCGTRTLRRTLPPSRGRRGTCCCACPRCPAKLECAHASLFSSLSPVFLFSSAAKLSVFPALQGLQGSDGNFDHGMPPCPPSRGHGGSCCCMCARCAAKLGSTSAIPVSFPSHPF